MHLGEMGRLLSPTGRRSTAVDRWLRAEPGWGFSGATESILPAKLRAEYFPCPQCGKRRGVVGFEERPLPHRCRP